MPRRLDRPVPATPQESVARGGHSSLATVLPIALLALTAAPAAAMSPFEGRYQGRGEGRLDLRVFGLDDGSDAHFVIAGTAIPDTCTGELRGIARPDGPATLVLRRKDAGADEACTLTLRFGPDRTRVRMSPQGCGDFHGPACDFEGTLTRR